MGVQKVSEVMTSLNHLTILSIEQATTLPFMTLRLVQDGARVIRVEAPPRGDPNRWVGPRVLPEGGQGTEFEEGMNAYFLPNNLGKESITLNLRTATGQTLLHRLINELPVDIFATNQRPRAYEKLGIDYSTLRAIKQDLIWVGITGFGPRSDEAAYDPILQARAGFMDLTGEAGGSPLLFGLPMVDLGAGEHAYGQVMKALYQRAETGKGARLDISMLQSAVSWMNSPVMLAHSFDIRSTRHGNTHLFFAPASVFPTQDAHVYLAVGNDRQWEAMTGLPGFETLAQEGYTRNAGRIAAVEVLNQQLASITRSQSTDDLLTACKAIGVPVSRVHHLGEVCDDPLIAENMVRAIDERTGLQIVIPPPPLMPEFLHSQDRVLTFPPRLGEHNPTIFGELGCDLAALKAEGVL